MIFLNLKSECEEREKKHLLGAFLGLPKGSPVLYLILCEQQEDRKTASSPSGINEKTNFWTTIKYTKKTSLCYN